jgi:subtilisin family serine protease/sugar lactone lactonase YvrE
MPLGAAASAEPELPAAAPPDFPSPTDPFASLESELSTAEAEGERVPGRYIVVLEDGISHPAEVAADQLDEGVGDLGFVFNAALSGYTASELTTAEVVELRGDPRVELVEPDRKIELEAQSIPTGIARVSAAGNETSDIDGLDDKRVDADVAVIDSGIDYQHPDLNLVQRIDCMHESGGCTAATATEWFYHGTHVAGTIGAIDNGDGVVGVAPGARLWDVQVFNLKGEGFTSWTIAGINWVAAHASQIEVANMSLGGAGVSSAENLAIAGAVDAGVVNAVAAGNQAVNSERRKPANSPDVITVSAIADYDGLPGGKGSPTCTNRGGDDTHATFSNWGSGVEIAAPGVCINSTLPGGKYGASWGTSFATPHVSGAAALLASKANPESRKDVEEIEQELVQGGSLDWNDTSEDGKPEPLLYLGQEPLKGTEAATGGWTATGDTSATLFGALNPRGSELEYRFEYGVGSGPAYEASVPAAKLEKSAGYTVVNQTVQGLVPGRTYHYRLSATSSSGTVYGKDHKLETSRWPTRTPGSGSGSSGDEWLEEVACPTTAFCMAVGPYATSSRAAGSYYLQAGEWLFRSMGLPAGGSNPAIRAVSCASSTACFAVGNVTVAGNIVPLAERWNGSTWTVETVPAPYAGAPYSVLTGVSCYSSTECLAVGYYKNATGIWVDYSAKLKSGAWTTVATPNPTDFVDQTLLEGISCASASFCIAVGRYHTKTATERPVLAEWNGTAWTLKVSARTSGYSYGISCPSKTFCMAVGGWGQSETWNGTQWTQQAVAFPAGASGYLKGVSCLSATYCAAVGTAWKGGRSLGLIDEWNGSTWSREVAPQQSEANHSLFGVSCRTGSGCAAVGGAEGGSRWTPLLEQNEEVRTEPPTDVLPGQAQLNGTLEPGGVTTSYRFEYGKTTAYGSQSPAGFQTVGGGAEAVEVAQELIELEAETVYHYRLVATRGGLTVYGMDRTFRTGTPQHHLVDVFGGSGSAPGQMDAPWGLDVDFQGNVWVADRNNDRVEKYNAQGELLTTFGSPGTGNGQFNEPLDVAVAADGTAWVTDGANARVQKFTSKGEYLAQFGSSGTGTGQFIEPWGIDITASGNLWVADARNYRIQKFTSGGAYLQQVGGFQGPRGLELDGEDHIWVTERSANRVAELSASGGVLQTFGSAGTGNGQFEEPQAIDLKPSGDVLVADRWNNRIQQFTGDGEYVAQFGNENLVEPRGVVEAGNGVVYVSNSWKDHVEKWQQNTPFGATEAVVDAGPTEAVLRAKVNPRTVATSYRFEYGETSAYGNSTALKGAGSGSSDLIGTEAVGGLKADTTYHYRVIATSSEGTVYGADRTLRTKPVAGPRLGQMALTEAFNSGKTAISDFAVDWLALGWATSGQKGANVGSGWQPIVYPSVAGSYFAYPVSDSGSGSAVAATVSALPTGSTRYASLWLDMPTPGAGRSGYEARVISLSTGGIELTLSRWQEGTQTPLDAKASALVAGNSIALADEGNVVSVWVNAGSGFEKVLFGADTAFASGYGGVEGSGTAARLTNFKVGPLLATAAGMDAALDGLVLNDTFSSNEDPLDAAGSWDPLAGDTSASGRESGRIYSGWGPFDGFPVLNGAYWTVAIHSDTGSGCAVEATLSARPAESGRFFSLWLDMSSPATTRNGYELRFTETSANVYETTLYKWAAGAKTTLAAKAGVSLPLDSEVALVDKGATVSAWTQTGSEFTQVLSAADSSYKGGFTGIEGSGSGTRLRDFRSAPLAPF